MIDPIAFHIFGVAIYWYGVAYFATCLIGIILVKRLARCTNGISATDVDRIVNYAILGVLLGGRIGDFLFYRPSFLLTSEVLQIRDGGMSFHGGVLGVVFSVLLFSFIYKKDKWKIWDLIVVVVPIGSFLGRISNYINGELVGIKLFEITQPVVLYEAFLEGALLFIILLYNFRTNLAIPGRTSALFLFFYGFFRFFCDFLKQRDALLSCCCCGVDIYLGVGQCLSMIMIVAGILIYRYTARCSKM